MPFPKTSLQYLAPSPVKISISARKRSIALPVAINREARRSPMKHLLFGLASFLIAGSPMLASEEMSPVRSATWQSGWGRITKGASTGSLVSWQVSDVKSGRINWAFLIPGDNNSVTADGYSIWSPGEINCKKGTYRAFIIFDGKDQNFGALDKAIETLATDFCDAYEDGFKDSPYYK